MYIICSRYNCAAIIIKDKYMYLYCLLGFKVTQKEKKTRNTVHSTAIFCPAFDAFSFKGKLTQCVLCTAVDVSQQMMIALT